MATRAPSAARRLAIAAPMPREPPVTRAAFPDNLVMVWVLQFDLADIAEQPRFTGATCARGRLENIRPPCSGDGEFAYTRAVTLRGVRGWVYSALSTRNRSLRSP